MISPIALVLKSGRFGGHQSPAQRASKNQWFSNDFWLFPRKYARYRDFVDAHHACTENVTAKQCFANAKNVSCNDGIRQNDRLKSKS